MFPVHDIKNSELKKRGFSVVNHSEAMLDGEKWIQIPILPYFIDAFWCLEKCKKRSFDDLWRLFLYAKREDDRIGAISVIAYTHSENLLRQINLEKTNIKKKTAKFLLEYVVNDFLPFKMKKKELLTHIVSHSYSNNTWVKILYELREIYAK